MFIAVCWFFMILIFQFGSMHKWGIITSYYFLFHRYMSIQDCHEDIKTVIVILWWSDSPVSSAVQLSKLDFLFVNILSIEEGLLTFSYHVGPSSFKFSKLYILQNSCISFSDIVELKSPSNDIFL